MAFQFLKKDFSLNHFVQINKKQTNHIEKINSERTRHKSSLIYPTEKEEKSNKNLILPYKLVKRNPKNLNYPRILTRNNNYFENKKNNLISSVNKLNLSSKNQSTEPSINNVNSNSNLKESFENVNELKKTNSILKIRLSSRKKQRKKILSPLSYSNNLTMGYTNDINNIDIKHDLDNIKNPEDLHIFNIYCIQKTKNLKCKFENIEIGDEILIN